MVNKIKLLLYFPDAVPSLQWIAWNSIGSRWCLGSPTWINWNHTHILSMWERQNGNNRFLNKLPCSTSTQRLAISHFWWHFGDGVFSLTQEVTLFLFFHIGCVVVNGVTLLKRFSPLNVTHLHSNLNQIIFKSHKNGTKWQTLSC